MAWAALILLGTGILEVFLDLLMHLLALACIELLKIWRPELNMLQYDFCPWKGKAFKSNFWQMDSSSCTARFRSSVHFKVFLSFYLYLSLPRRLNWTKKFIFSTGKDKIWQTQAAKDKLHSSVIRFKKLFVIHETSQLINIHQPQLLFFPLPLRLEQYPDGSN